MKEFFEEAEVEIIEFTTEDVVTDSYVNPDEGKELPGDPVNNN